MSTKAHVISVNKVGRPRLGTETDRHDALLSHALKLLMSDGYAQTSIGKIAASAGVSTRTIYERYNNKADLMVAAVSQMVAKDMESRIDLGELQAMEPSQALFTLGMFLLERATSPEIIPMYRMGASEAFRFPELAKKMQTAIPKRIEGLIASYLTEHSNIMLRVKNVEDAAKLFIYMVIAEPRHKALFGTLEKDADWNAERHVKNAVDVFLNGIVDQDA